MIQGGDHTGTGTGGIGYTIADEITPGERADKAGQMFMATRGAGTGEAQFFITARPAPHIDGKFTKLGECSPIKLIDTISRVPSSGKPLFKPATDVVIRGVEVRRLQGGRMKWIPKGTDLSVPSSVPEGRAVHIPASPPPSKP
jgi:peptidyl-prolyl cis-trans isomerase A (cyclophilin A)